MSSMLEQAIVDAKSLREAAIRNAEETLVEKYSDDIKEAVEKLLEQDEGLLGAEEEAEEGDIEGLTLAAFDGEDGCACPEEEAVLDLDLPAIKVAIASIEGPEMGMTEPHEAAAEDVMALEEGIILIEQDDLSSREGYDPDAPAWNYLSAEEINAGTYGYVDPQTGILYPDGPPGEDRPSYLSRPSYDPDVPAWNYLSAEEINAGTYGYVDPQTGILYPEGPPVDEVPSDSSIVDTPRRVPPTMDEELDLTEEELASLLEKVVVDMAPVSNGWAGRPLAELEYEEDKHKAVLAQEHEIDVLRQENKNLEGYVYKLQESVEIFRNREQKYNEIVSSLKEKFSEMSLSNARLLYTNKVLNSASLNERQKSRVVDAISNVNSAEEAKVIFEALQNAVGSSPVKRRGPKSLSETVERKSSSLLASRRKKGRETDVPDSAKSRMQRLAGIK